MEQFLERFKWWASVVIIVDLLGIYHQRNYQVYMKDLTPVS